MSTKDFQQKAVDQFESEELRGMTIRKTRAIECIVNEKGETHYYKIKATAQEETYFGAIPLTAWKVAAEKPDNFTFVIAIYNSKTDRFKFIRKSPEELLAVSSVPPFKIDFNLNLASKSKQTKQKKTIKSLQAIKNLVKIYKNDFNGSLE